MSSPSLKDLTSLGVFSGRISEVHMMNLKNFPWIFFDGLKEVSITYDVEQMKENKGTIQYDLTLDADNDHIQERCLAVEAAVRSLFWKEMKVVISISKTEVFKSV